MAVNRRAAMKNRRWSKFGEPVLLAGPFLYSMDKSLEQEDLRRELAEVCRRLGEQIHTASAGLAADTRFVFTENYKTLRAEISSLRERLEKLKHRRRVQQHYYSVILHGDVVKDGRIVHDCPVSCDLNSVIDCKLGDATSLSQTVGSHRAFWNLLCAKFGALFHKRKFRMDYIVQLR